MLDPASIERLAELPDQNDPRLNVALAEEGKAKVLLALLNFAALGAEAVDVIARRLVAERATLLLEEDDPSTSAALVLEARLIGHLSAPRDVRDALLAAHAHDPFFVLSAAMHPDATPLSLTSAARWPSVSPLHDRQWVPLLEAAEGDPALLAQWSAGDELTREAAAALAHDPALLERLAADPARRVRRAAAGNPRIGDARERLAVDPAPEVRARAARPPHEPRRELGPRFAAFVRAIEQGGALAQDVRQALLGAGASLDEEGAFLAARHLERDELCALVGHATSHERCTKEPHGRGVGTGLGLRRAAGLGPSGEEAALTSEIVHIVTRCPSSETRLTGKARVAQWIAESLACSSVVDGARLAAELGPHALASDRMVLLRWAARAGASLAPVCALDVPAVAASVVELCWRDPAVSHDAAVALSTRVAESARAERELPEDELDLAPLARPLAVLERAVLAAIARTPVSPRAAMAAIALDPRRCRYVLSAMPTWKGPLTGARLARVLRSHAGALSAAAKPASSTAPPAAGPRAASVARWADRKLTELEAAIAIAIGDLTAAELLRRLSAGAIALHDGIALAAGVEARAAIDGAPIFAPLLEHAATRRTRDAAWLAFWMLVEGLDRLRAPSLIASAIDGLSVSGAVVSPAVCEALATLERRAPGRLETVYPQSPRGRATVASAIARAYRAFGGMRDES